MKKQNIFSIIHITIYLIYASCIVYFVTVRNFRSIIVSILSLIGIIISFLLSTVSSLIKLSNNSEDLKANSFLS